MSLLVVDGQPVKGPSGDSDNAKVLFAELQEKFKFSPLVTAYLTDVAKLTTLQNFIDMFVEPKDFRELCIDNLREGEGEAQRPLAEN